MAVDVWTIDVGPVLGKTGSRKDISCEGELANLENTVAKVPEGKPVSLGGEIEAIEGNRVVLEGRVQTGWTGECRRCLQMMTGDIDVSVREIFEQQNTEGETYPINTGRIAADQVAREAVMLELPVAPLCRPDCKGLCPSCGANLNEAECGCKVDVTDPRWAALDQLKND